LLITPKIANYEAIILEKDMNRLRYFVEDQIFGVCTRIGEKLKFPPSTIRLYFIYATFMTFGSPIILYLVLAFWMELRQHWRRSSSPTIWEL
jgi:phage shock protein C